MGVLQSILMLLIGLGLLNYGSDWFTLGNTKIAKYFKLSNFVIGATIVAFATSFPEIVTSLYATYAGLPIIAVGNALGSCIINIGFILGLCALISPLVVKQKSILRNSQIYLLYSLLLFILGYDGFNFIDGVILFFLLLGYIGYTLKKRDIVTEEDRNDRENVSIILAIILAIVGLISIFIGSKLFIDGVRNIAIFLGIPNKVVGFILVAFGTSLPEVAVSFSAIRRELSDIVIGNIIGSNMINIGCALALSSMIAYIPPTRFGLSIYILLVVLMVLFMNKGVILRLFGRCSNEYFKISRIEGLFLFMVYLVYVLVVTNVLRV
ncbi:calcium/sodium antiporter [Methanofervidicoccus abyssi]|nr:calcium/sodium antiporter [Methanofervidicoccus abyssi]